MKFLLQLTITAALAGAVLQGQNQTPDSSGNGMLNGAFHFRHVAILNVDQNGNPTQVRAAYGTMTFDGNGNYSVSGTFVDNTVSNAQPQTLSVTGTYAIGGNGTGYLANPLDPTNTSTNNSIYGAVSQGAFIGSATEGALNDILIAIPSGAAPTNATFTTAYQVGLLDFAGASSAAIKNALFKLTPDGKGGLGTISLTGHASNQSSSTLTQTVTGATYNFNADGTATLTIPNPSGVTSVNALFSGTRTLAVSADGNFVLGWTPNGFDIDFGVKAFTSPATDSLNKGLYFLSGLEDSPTGFGEDSFYGSYNADGAGNQIMHLRISSPFFYPYDYGTDDQILLNGDGTTGADFNGYQYAFGDKGLSVVGIGTGGFYTLVAGTQSGPYSQTSSVFLNPVGIVNAASYAPITASLAPGELITLFGSNLSSTTLSMQGGQAFPTTLGNVQVTINNTLCPIYYVSPNQISAIVPYALNPTPTQFLANVQVSNGGTLSNTVQMYLSDSAPGVFSQTQNGIGVAAALHASDGSVISQSNPVRPGEYISLFLTGLGTVTPAIADGALGPSSPFSTSDLNTKGLVAVYFNDYGPNGSTGNQGTIQFAGLAPGLAGLYQLNVQVPTTGLVTGDSVYVEIQTDSADINQIQVPVGAAASSTTSALSLQTGSSLQIDGGRKGASIRLRQLHRTGERSHTAGGRPAPSTPRD